MSNYSFNAVAILTCFSFADNTTVASLAANKIPHSFFTRHHDGALGIRRLPSSQGLRIPVRVNHS